MAKYDNNVWLLNSNSTNNILKVSNTLSVADNKTQNTHRTALPYHRPIPGWCSPSTIASEKRLSRLSGVRCPEVSDRCWRIRAYVLARSLRSPTVRYWASESEQQPGATGRLSTGHGRVQKDGTWLLWLAGRETRIGLQVALLLLAVWSGNLKVQSSRIVETRNMDDSQ